MGVLGSCNYKGWIDGWIDGLEPNCVILAFPWLLFCYVMINSLIIPLQACFFLRPHAPKVLLFITGRTRVLQNLLWEAPVAQPDPAFWDKCVSVWGECTGPSECSASSVILKETSTLLFRLIILIWVITWKGSHALMFSKHIGFLILSISAAPLSSLSLRHLVLVPGSALTSPGFGRVETSRWARHMQFRNIVMWRCYRSIVSGAERTVPRTLGFFTLQIFYIHKTSILKQEVREELKKHNMSPLNPSDHAAAKSVQNTFEIKLVILIQILKNKIKVIPYRWSNRTFTSQTFPRLIFTFAVCSLCCPFKRKLGSALVSVGSYSGTCSRMQTRVKLWACYNHCFVLTRTNLQGPVSCSEVVWVTLLS